LTDKIKTNDMKKIILQISVLLIILIFNFSNIKSADNPVFTTNDTTNVVMEIATGTWCGYCPCGHQIMASILQSYPHTAILCYHGPPNYGTPADPWATVGYPMIQLFGMTSYPTGVISRTSGILSRGSWLSTVQSYASQVPTVRVVLTNPTINNTTRKVTGTISATALQNLTGAYSVFVAITENHVIYPQNIYASCGTAGVQNDYIHDHVVKAVVTPNAGTQITAGPWNTNTTLTYNLDYTIPSGIELANCNVVMFVFKQGTPYTTGAPVQNALSAPTSQFIPTGVGNFETKATEYSLSQNYPNPFNPSTTIRFTVPKDGNVSFKIYDISGKEVSNYFNGYLKAGIYTLQFDGSSLTSGVYFYKMKSNDFSDVKRMILVK
jgi:hypothetical protein